MERTTSAETRWVTWLLGVMVLWVLLQAVGLFGVVHDATLILLFGGCVAAMVYGVRHYQPTPRWPWALAATAFTLFFFGGLARQTINTLGDLSADRSLIPDMITLPGYLLLGAVVIGITRSRQPDRDARMDALLDAVVAALAVLTLAWIFLINPALLGTGSPLPVQITVSMYPALSAFLVAIVVQLLFTSRGQAPLALKLIFVAFAAMLVGDTVYMFVETGALDLPQRVVDVPYSVALICVIGAALHPSFREVTEPAPAEPAPSTSTTARLTLVAIALGIPALVTVTGERTSTGDRIALGTIVLLLTATAIARVVRALHAHARSERRLVHQAYHDALTGLPNRTRLQAHLSDVLARQRAPDTSTALLLLDIDRFKLMNDSHGHSLGDEMLCAVAKRLTDTAGNADLVARIGGDEFVILLSSVSSEAVAHDAAERTRLCFSIPFQVRGAEISCSVSIGVAVTDGTDPDVDAETLLREADTAVYEAKAAGRDTVTVFDNSMRDRVAKRLALEGDLRHALDRSQLRLEYQPIVAIPGAEVQGFEALLRWTHPTMGEISPITFIPVAEDTGLIVPIGAWVLEQACRQLGEWRRELPHGHDLYVAVNLSARQLHDEDLVQQVRESLVATNLPGRALTLELTESVLMENPPAAVDLLGAIQQLGVQIAIDDFGTGYSSLSYLRQFPADHVKIDRSFVNGLDQEDGSEASLVAAIIAMARAMNITTIAEGVERASQAVRLQALGCRLAQGYHYSRPVRPEEIPNVCRGLRGDGTDANAQEGGSAL